MKEEKREGKIGGKIQNSVGDQRDC